MINKYIISNGAAELFVTQRNGKTHSVFVDEENIKKLKELDVLWHVQWNEKANKYYAHATIYLGNSKYKNIMLHTFLFGERGKTIDHKDNNGLDNREANIRITTKSNNCKNRFGRNSNNTSGYRNVSWIRGHWRVQLQANGKNHMFPEKFEDVDKAGRFAKSMRKKYYGDFAGKE